MKIGDKVKVRNITGPVQPSEYKIIEIGDDWIKLKHPNIGGYFVFSKDLVVEVISCK